MDFKKSITAEEEQRISVFHDIMREPLDSRYYPIQNTLIKKGFFKAPAGLKHHGTAEGDLFEHSKEVTLLLLYHTNKLNLKWENSWSPYIVGMFHDLCKTDDYVYNEENGKWEWNEQSLLTGHGDKSVILAQSLLPLTEEEMYCIRWHMGAFDEKKNWNKYSNACEQYPNVLYTHIADMVASQIKGI